MIQNFTKAEWRALAGAVDYFYTLMDDDPGRYGTARQRALDRAFEKARQLAPEPTEAR